MKNLLLLVVLTLTFISCEKDDSNETPSTYSIEGKWLLANAGGSEFLPNTMYEFQNGLRYTYYCNTIDCDDAYWNDQNINDAIPSSPEYTFEDNTLTIGGDILYNVEFTCDGAVVNIIFDESIWSWWRIGTDLDTCN